MKKTVSNVIVGEDKVRSRVRIEGDECLNTSQQFKMGAYMLLQIIASQPDLTACLMSPFETLTVYHNGKSWVADAEATVALPPGGVYVEDPSSSNST